MSPNEQIVRAARGWLGTRFHHQGRLKKTAGHAGGVDCLGLLIGVAAELGLRGRGGAPLAALDQTDYGHLPDGAALKSMLDAHLYPLPVGGILPGDVLLISLQGQPRHLAIVTNGKADTLPGMGIIHAYAQARKVVEHGLDDWWRERICGAYRVAMPGFFDIRHPASDIFFH